MNRIEKICSYLDRCELLTDVGCDHGYCTKYALDNGLCKYAQITDISAKSLSKAEALLNGYIANGACKSYCTDGLKGIESFGQVLIAGMGGMEIIKIFSESGVPQKFVLQPMKNPEKVREYLLKSGCVISADDIFFCGKYYFIIKGERKTANGAASSPYTKAQLIFGRDSLNNPVFTGFARAELKKLNSYLTHCTEGAAKIGVQERINFLKEAAGIV